jgi:Uma2 family endonuclease
MTPVALDLESMLPAMFTAPDLSEEQFFKICGEFPDAKVEYNACDGTITLMPPTDPDTGDRHSLINGQLDAWRKVKGGKVGDSSTGFRFPNGSRFSPDASWFDAERWQRAKRPGTRFPVFAPEFVIELRSPDDRIRPLREKMEEYMANGVQLGWLIDPKERTVTIYRPGRPPLVLDHPAEVSGEGPMEGFVLKLEGILD